MRTLSLFILCIVSGGLLYNCSPSGGHRSSRSEKIEILFLGHDSEHHNSARFLPLLASALSLEGINFTYSSDPGVLNDETLADYDGVMIYANHETITPEQEEALLDFVSKGGGFIPLHCASFCFQNSPAYIDLVGGQFLKHDTGTFVASIVEQDHPVVGTLTPFSTWDETYVHSKLSDDRTVLMERVEGDHHEPWTWVKEHGKGREFYTAYGHDERTRSNHGFHQLVKQGILWAVGDNVKARWETFRETMPQLVYRDEAAIPNYERRDPAPRYQEPLSPEESKKLIQVPVGFSLELFASEPDIINPIAMEWDEQGRLWVIETVDYPNTVRDEEGVGDDRIKICEDTDGDGKADKFTIFADKLNIPTSLTFSNGGIIVSQAPVFLFLKDTDGDDKADVRRVIIDGWGTFDTHAGPSNLRYGFDNQIWGVVGYSGFKGTIAGQNHQFSQGIYRFKPDVSSFEFLTPTSNNTWGLGFTGNNDVFASTANNTHSVFMGIPNNALKGVEGAPLKGSLKLDGHYAMHPNTLHVRQVDVFGGFTAASGHSFYTARNYPAEYGDNTAFVCEPTGHLVHIARINKDGAGFTESDGWNLFASADEWVAPVEAKVGPDGAVWVLDWYNFIVQHNPTPTPERGGYQAQTGAGNAYENPLRDRSHGRVWRVVSQQAKRGDRIALDKDDEDELIDALSHDNMFWRLTAQRLLVERGNTDVLPQLYKLAKNTRVDDAGNNFAAIHALWTIDGLGALNKDDNAAAVVTGALKHPAAGVRKAAIQILSKGHWTEQEINQSEVLQDPDPGVRLAAILALVRITPSDETGKVLYALSLEENIKNDFWLSQAVYAAAVQHKQGFITAFREANPNYSTQPEAHYEGANIDDSGWEQMKLPQYMERAGLDIDGEVWFRKTVRLPGGAPGAIATISFGTIDDADETWINGVRVGATERGNIDRIYSIPKGTLVAGENHIAVKLKDRGGWGGFTGEEEEMFIQTGARKVALAGDWKYKVGKKYPSGKQNIFEGSSIGEAFMAAYSGQVKGSEINTTATARGDATVIRIRSIKNEMKYDVTSFEVEAGKRVEIIFENPDFMQHNLVIVAMGALETLGKAADKLASDPRGADMQYVPDIPEVLFSTKLLNPEETVTLSFIAPEKPGDYPYVCTFPGHWSLMNGVMKVVNSKTVL